MFSHSSCLPMLHGRPKFCHPSPKTWHWVLCLQALSTTGPGSSAWWEQALMLRCPFYLGERPPACSSMPGCHYIPAVLQSVSDEDTVGREPLLSLVSPPQLPPSQMEQGLYVSGGAALYLSLPFKSSLHWVEALSVEVINPERIRLSITPGAS